MNIRSVFAIFAICVLAANISLAQAASNGKPNSPTRVDWCRSNHIKCTSRGNDACRRENPKNISDRNTCVNGVLLACKGMFGKGSDCQTSKLVYRLRVKMPGGQTFAPK